MTSLLTKVAVVAGVAALAATATVAAVGLHSYRATGSVIPPAVRRVLDECAGAELRVAGCPIFQYRATPADGE